MECQVHHHNYGRTGPAYHRVLLAVQKSILAHYRSHKRIHVDSCNRMAGEIINAFTWFLLTFQKKECKSCSKEVLNRDRGKDAHLLVFSPVEEENRVGDQKSNFFIELDDSKDIKHTKQEEEDNDEKEKRNQVETSNPIDNANHLHDL